MIMYRKNPRWDIIYLDDLNSKKTIIENILNNLSERDKKLLDSQMLDIDIIDIETVAVENSHSAVTNIITRQIVKFAIIEKGR